MTAIQTATQEEALGRYRPYPDYKQTGVDWLGEIPTHWEIARVGDLMTLVNGYPFDSEFFVRGEGVPLVRIRDMGSTETEVNYTGPVIDEAWIETGDIIIGMDGDFNVDRWRGPRALLNQRMCCLRARSGTDSGFASYLLPAPLKVINDLTYSTTVKHLSSSDVHKIRLGLPPKPEQRAIASFLDRETARIDALVAKKQRLIELLQEQRTALITRAVTKGLDPTVPMKDSGVEWLGEIPEHWEVERGKHLFRALSDAPIEGDGVVTAYRDGEVTLRENRRTEGYTFAIQEVGYQRVRHGDLVINGMDAFAGAIGVSDSTGKCTPEYLVLEPVNPTMDSCFFANALRLMAKRGFILVVCNAVRERAPRFRLPQFQDILLPVPPVNEQHAIAQFILLECERIDPLINKVCEAITRLQELRSALVSAAVTGKIDVREEVV